MRARDLPINEFHDQAKGQSTAEVYTQIPLEDRIDRTEALKARSQTDLERWRNSANFKSNWSLRAQTVAGMVAEGSRVLDLGCGQMDLAGLLPPSCKYIPADIFPRNDETLHCDLNEGVFPDVEADLVTMLGVIEYIHNPERLLGQLAERWSRLIMTYNPSDLDQGRERRVHGWFCNLTSAEMVAVAMNAGYELVAIVPTENRQVVYEFRGISKCVN